MKHAHSSTGWLGVAFLLLAAPAAAQQPRDLEQCYLRVALEKSGADAMHLAREICDAVFRPSPRALAVSSPRDGTCSEWWFDRRGRHETDERYCALESRAEGVWQLACQGKGGRSQQVTWVELREAGDRFERVGALRGTEVGELFPSLTGCVRSQLSPAAGD